MIGSPDGTRPALLTIKLVRHGQSLANVGEVRGQDVGDQNVALTPLGHQQARDAGGRIGSDFIASAIVFSSPFLRTRQTLAGVLAGAGVSPATVRIYEDPRLREVEHGYADVEPQRALQQVHGAFFYRFHGGESPADCYDRTSGFMESLMRQAERKKADRALIVTHGLAIRCFVMRFFHLTVEQFESMMNPKNCDVITIAARHAVSEPVFSTSRWGVTGLSVRGSPVAKS
jgi:broad specificity phosphatase PhoE